jgi:chromatin remodeling complex protein RSC6
MLTKLWALCISSVQLCYFISSDCIYLFFEILHVNHDTLPFENALTTFSSSASKRKRGGSGGLNKVCAISPELQTIVGETAMSRTQVPPVSL